MEKYPLVSVLIPVYNREKYIKETVTSALTQTYKNIEVVVVDNCSSDNTWNILQELALKDKRIKLYKNKKNIGPVRNWKRCIDEANGGYGKILWSDDIISYEFLERTIPLLNNKDVGFVFTRTEVFSDNKKQNDSYIIGESGLYETKKFINGVLFEGNYPVSPGCALFRLEDLRKNLLINIPNKVDSDFSLHAVGNDLLIFLLTAHQYKKFGFINIKLSFFRAHVGSISIDSGEGHLSLHYKLASAYFIENYQKDLIKKMNTNIWVDIKKFRSDAKKYNLYGVENFYLTNKCIKLDYIYLFKKALKKIGIL